MSFIRRSLKIYKCPVVILFYSFSIIITFSNVVLRISIPIIRCLLIVVEAVLNIAFDNDGTVRKYGTINVGNATNTTDGTWEGKPAIKNS